MNGATEQLPRLLSLVPYLLTRPGARLADVAQTFGVSEEQIARDLELDQLEVPLPAPVGEVDCAAPARRAGDQSRCDGHLVGPVFAASTPTGCGNRTLQHDLATRIICADSRLKLPAPVLLRPIAIGGSIPPLVVVGHCSKYQVHDILIGREPQAAHRRAVPRAGDSQRTANSLLYVLNQRPWSD